MIGGGDMNHLFEPSVLIRDFHTYIIVGFNTCIKSEGLPRIAVVSEPRPFPV